MRIKTRHLKCENKWEIPRVNYTHDIELIWLWNVCHKVRPFESIHAFEIWLINREQDARIYTKLILSNPNI